MKKSIIIAIVILLALVSFVASKKDNNLLTKEDQKNKVATTIFPLYDITRQIAGDEFEVVLLLPAGASPHTFDPQPSLLKELQESKAIFAIGYGLDNWSTTIAQSINAPIIPLDHNIDLRATVDEHDEHDDNDHDNHVGHNHGPIDPHYWLSIHSAEQITTNIANELSELDPANADLYQNRAETYKEKLESLEDELENKTQSLSNKNIISLHDAWYYFAEEFNLNLVGTFEPSAGKEPSPRYISELKDAVDKYDVSTLFMEPQLSQTSIKSFTNDNNLSIAIIDPLGGVEGRNSYIELMRYNVDQVVTALNKE